MKIGAKRAEPAAGDGFREAPMRGGSYTRQLCKMLKLEVVSFSRRKFIFGSRRVDVAIGRWNKEAQEFEIVTPWCPTWEGLEEEARRAVKAFRGMVDAKHRGTSNV
ncbi:MAG: hypothetical protein KGL75_07330 [Acidobacteriota bacterium]|nr:hypothetical protein [Acidobacteriota bacterium]